MIHLLGGETEEKSPLALRSAGCFMTLGFCVCKMKMPIVPTHLNYGEERT